MKPRASRRMAGTDGRDQACGTRCARAALAAARRKHDHLPGWTVASLPIQSWRSSRRMPARFSIRLIWSGHAKLSGFGKCSLCIVILAQSIENNTFVVPRIRGILIYPDGFVVCFKGFIIFL
jgi:hypothetical protein